MSYHLFLDDERKPNDVTWKILPRDKVWVIVRNYQQFVDYINEFGVPGFVTFDHDLADEHYSVMLEENSYEHDDGDLKKTFNYGTEKTGYDCAKWLVDHCHLNDVPFPEYEVHSMNPVGAQRITLYISDARAAGYVK